MKYKAHIVVFFLIFGCGKSNSVTDREKMLTDKFWYLNRIDTVMFDGKNYILAGSRYMQPIDTCYMVFSVFYNNGTALYDNQCQTISPLVGKGHWNLKSDSVLQMTAANWPDPVYDTIRLLTSDSMILEAAGDHYNYPTYPYQFSIKSTYLP